MAPRLGVGAFIGFGELASWNSTPGAGDMEYYMKATSGFDAIQFENEELVVENLQYYDQHSDDTLDGVKRVSGNLTIRPTYESLQNLLRWITGHNVAVAGSGPYSYAFVPTEPSGGSFYPRGKALGIEIYRGGDDANSIFYGPLTFNDITFNFEAGGFMTIDLGIMGCIATEDTKSAAPSFGSNYVKLPTGQADASGVSSSKHFLQINGVTYVCRNCSMTIGHRLEERRDITSVLPLEPYPNGWRETMINAEIEVTDDTLLGNLISGGTLTGTTAIYVETSSTYNLKFEFPAIRLQAPTEGRVEGPGIVTANLDFKALRDDSDPSYKVTLYNNDSAYAA